MLSIDNPAWSRHCVWAARWRRRRGTRRGSGVQKVKNYECVSRAEHIPLIALKASANLANLCISWPETTMR